jgi:hypothetical protein
MTTPKVSSLRKNGQQHTGRLVYAGIFILWMLLGGVMILALPNFVELLHLSNERPSMAASTSLPPAVTTSVKPKTTTTNPNDMFVVGIMFADKQKYVDSLQAEVDTWMSEMDMERIFAVGPERTIAHKQGFPRAVKSRCVDRSLWCKRVQHIAEAHKMSQSGIHFDWLLSGNEDWYVNLPTMREVLGAKDPNDPVVYAALGCGYDWEHNPNSKGGTLPMPKGYRVNPKQQCDALSQKGGICGGYGVVFSRAAIEIMMQNGEDGLFNTTQSAPFKWNTHLQGDPVLSCLIHAFADRGVRMEEKPWAAQNARYIINGGELTMRRKPVGTSHGVPFDGMTGAEILRKLYDVQKAQA